jgi:hypothetical protein
MGLLGDLTGFTPSFGVNMNFVFYMGSDADIALRCRWGGDSWFGSHKIKGTDHRAKLRNNSVSLGLMYYFAEDSDGRYYLCAEAGAVEWSIDSSTYPPLNSSRYFKPRGAIYIGTDDHSVYLEAGIELNFLETGMISFKKYNSFNVSLVAGFGYKWRSRSGNNRGGK